MKQPLLSLKALSSELKHEVWLDRSACDGCPNRQYDVNFGEYCESDSILNCVPDPCEVYQNYLEMWYTPEELKALAPFPMQDTRRLTGTYEELNPGIAGDDLITAINQYQLIRQLQEQSSCK